MIDATPAERAYLTPFFAFFIPPLLGAVIGTLFDGQAFWMVAHPEYWVQPLQTVLCAGVLARYWRFYQWQWPQRPLFALFIGVLALGVWIAPLELFHAAPRLKGFEPHFFGADGFPYYANLSMRFLRLVVIVPLVEEIFWRGFLLRYLAGMEFMQVSIRVFTRVFRVCVPQGCTGDFLQVPIGAFTRFSCVVVALFFMLEHQPVDYAAALVTGFLFNAVAYRTRSLSACVLTHAVTNLLLGVYILKTCQWGFW